MLLKNKDDRACRVITNGQVTEILPNESADVVVGDQLVIEYTDFCERELVFEETGKNKAKSLSKYYQCRAKYNEDTISGLIAGEKSVGYAIRNSKSEKSFSIHGSIGYNHPCLGYYCNEEDEQADREEEEAMEKMGWSSMLNVAPDLLEFCSAKEHSEILAYYTGYKRKLGIVCLVSLLLFILSAFITVINENASTAVLGCFFTIFAFTGLSFLVDLSNCHTLRKYAPGNSFKNKK